MTKKIKKITTTVKEEIIDVPLNEKTHIICILDRSGSMASIIDDSIGGFNTFLKEQKKLPDEATITVALFDDKYDLIYNNVDIKKASELTKDEWMPRGSTALYDAIGKTINSEREKINKLGSEKPSKILACIVTDGFENSSVEYDSEIIKSLIKTCENDDWNFIYLAANQDAMTVGNSFGISVGNTFTYSSDSVGVNTMSNVMYNVTTNYRSMNKNDDDFDVKSKSMISNENNR